MKSNSTLFCNAMLCVVLTLPFSGLAQFNPGLSAGFGIDGDAFSGQSQNIAGTSPQGSFDWFRSQGAGSNVGIGVIDTSNTAIYGTQIAIGKNVSFTKGMSFPRYSIQNGYLLLDARYSRDNFGFSNAPDQSDLTTYTSGAKNGDNPTSWSTTPNGATISDKADIIDTYIHMRRNGTIINSSNPSPLILALGISTVGNTGIRYVDFELFHSRISYDSTTGIFSNSGPLATGGHSPWGFNADGTVSAIGDMTVSFSYSNAGVEEIGVYIWVSYANYKTITPNNFAFVPNEYYGIMNGYGYAKVKPQSANAFKAWGSASTDITNSPKWGTNSKSIGGSPNNYSSTVYAAYDFGEVAIDLTSMGIDPALSVGMDPCSPPFTRVMAKSRSSVSFTSSLQDFSGPYEFLDAPQASPQIASPGILKCNVASTILSPAAPVSGASYQWTTTNGNIVSDPNATSIVVDKPGTYYLTTAIVSGCPTRTDSATVQGDYIQPVASASVVGMLVPNYPLITVQLVGGDANLSKVISPYGGSTGLDWSWSGPAGFTANTKDVTTALPGSYTLILTEQRNGCKDTATIETAMAAVLPVKYLSFDAAVSEKTVLLTWVTTGEINNSHFEVERSFSGNNFKTIGLVLAPLSVLSDKNSYKFKDNSSELPGQTYAYYRLKQFDLDGNFYYSSILRVKLQSPIGQIVMTVSPNPFVEKVTLGFEAVNNGSSILKVVNISGQSVLSKQANLSRGYNSLQLEGLGKLNAGVYILQLLVDGTVIYNQRIIKQ
jgi:hypothetical protein